MQTGTKISGAFHLVLLGWAVFGGAFDADPLPFEVQSVSVITAEQFTAMTANLQPVEVTATPVALTPSVPEIFDDNVEVEEQAVSEPALPPEPEVELETLPEPPETSPAPPPRPVDRVAPEPVAAPLPDTRPADVETPEVSPDEGAEVPQEQSEAQAPEEAVDEIVTETEESADLAPTRSPRPRARPTRRPAVAETEENTPDTALAEPADETPPARTDVSDALAEALGNNTPSPSAPTGPPLTGGEKDALRVAVSNCWNVGSLSSAALRTTVVVSVSMTREGKPEAGSIRLMSSSDGTDVAAKQAYEAARRAIIRCGSKGFKLPAEKYGQWRDIEMTFNPERMRIK